MKVYDYKMYLLCVLFVLFVGLTVFYICLTLRTAEKSFFLIVFISNIEVFDPLVILRCIFCDFDAMFIDAKARKKSHSKQEISPIVSPAIISGKPALHQILDTVFLNLFPIIEFTV